MKITIFLFLIISVISGPNVYGQTMMIGARAGINLANEKFENLADGESLSFRAFFLSGVQVDYQFANSLALSVQLLYNQKGTHAEMGSNYGGSTADWTISYLEVPILVKGYFDNDNVRPYLFGGLSMGFLIKNVEKLHSSGIYSIPNGVGAFYSKDTVANITDSTAKFDFSLIAGAGISVTLASGFELFIDAGFAFGLNNVDNYNADKGKDYYVYSRDIRIVAGILFPIY